jgi:Heavy metal binding domain
MRAQKLILLAGLAGLLTGCSSAPPADQVPPVVYICPMVKDAAVLEDHAGKCPVCGMELKPVRIVKAYSCLNNTAFIQATPGKCKINGTDLVPITASMFWVCPQTPDKHELDPGKCADGTDRIQKFEPRLHGDHNPRHGGQLFMADDGWHHLEGTYRSPGLFRVFFYDDWTRPLAPEGFAARVSVKDSTGKELTEIPLQKTPAADAMEAQIPKASMPLITTVRVRFKPDEPEKSFDFTFKDYSKEPGAPPATTSTTSTTEPARPTPTPPTPTPTPAPTVGTAAAPPNQPPQNYVATPLQAEPIPPSAREILVELSTRRQELAEKIDQGAALTEFWFPALRTKDLALALVNEHLSEIPSRQRSNAEDAVGRLTRAAYAIDNFGDLGDREKLVSAYETFVLAVNDLRSAYASIR